MNTLVWGSLTLAPIRREIKPRNKSQLIVGIKHFWNTFDAHKCCKYINHHSAKGNPSSHQLDGAATGY